MKNHSAREFRRQPWNRFQWQVRGRRSRRHGPLILQIEKLESRSLLAGDVAAFDPATGEVTGPAATDQQADLHSLSAVVDKSAIREATGPLVNLSLSLTNPDGSPLTSLHAGQDFVLHVFGDDLRDAPHGVFSAYFDLSWDSALAAVSGPLQFSSAYPNLHLGDTSIAGFLDEAGAFGSFDESGAGPHEILSVPMKAISPGGLVIASDAAEAPINQVLVFGLNENITADRVQFGSASQTIDPPLSAALSAVNNASTNPASAASASTSSAMATDAALAASGSTLEQNATGSDQLLQLLIMSTMGPPATDTNSSDESAVQAVPSDTTADAAGDATPLPTANPVPAASDEAQEDNAQAAEEEAIDAVLEPDADAFNLL